MAQVPATPKTRRNSLLLAARLLGPRALNQADLQASERAALDLRLAAPAAPPATPQVVFLIPLVGRHHVRDWDQVSHRLCDTLHSLQAQTDPNWHALICGQDHPNRPDTITNDPRITFLPFTTPFEGNDKWAKLHHLCQSLPNTGVRAGYAMPFDADDLLHPAMVGEMRQRNTPGGYLMAQGLVFDVGNNRIARAAPPSLAQPLRKPFWKLCGSCAAFAFDLDHAPETQINRLTTATQHEHRMFPYLAALAGRPLAPLSRAGALYMLNHGENFGARRGRVSFKQRFAARFEITDPTQLAEIRRDFARA